MRKLHWLNGERTMCRPLSLDQLKRDVAEKVTQVTCQPCLKALGLSNIAFQASTKKARLILTLPNKKKAICLVENFDLSVMNAPVIQSQDEAMDFIAKEPEPISIKMRLTEDGYAHLKAAMMRK